MRLPPTLVALTLTHTLVDASALLIAPLWPQLRERFHLGAAGLFVLFVFQSLPQSFSQLIFGYLRDRLATRCFVWLGPLTAAAALTWIGEADGPWILCGLLLLGGMGIGAFHPEAAAAAGEAIPGQRARALSVFMFGGAMGLALGPLISGTVVSRYGLSGLVWVGPPLLLAVLVLRRWTAPRAGDVSVNPISAVSGSRPAENPIADYRQETQLAGRNHRGSEADNTGIASPPGLDDDPAIPVHRSENSTREEATPASRTSGGFGLAVFVLLICSLRIVPNLAMDKVLSFTVNASGSETLRAGFAQAVFLGAASVGMLAMAGLFQLRWERAFLVLCPLSGIPLLALMGAPWCPVWLLIALLVPAGAILWGTMPAMVSYAQRLFPQATGMASAITMGASWGVAGLIQAALTSWAVDMGEPRTALFAMIPCLLAAGAGAWLLPQVPPVQEPSSDTVLSQARLAEAAEL